jgi:hypothetical protein
MKDIGFESGYVAQGGDIGSRIARALAVDYESCKAVHRESQMVLDIYRHGIIAYTEEST